MKNDPLRGHNFMVFRGFFGFYKGIKGIKEGIKEFTKEFIILQELSGAVLNFFIPENAYNTIHFKKIFG